MATREKIIILGIALLEAFDLTTSELSIGADLPNSIMNETDYHWLFDNNQIYYEI